MFRRASHSSSSAERPQHKTPPFRGVTYADVESNRAEPLLGGRLKFRAFESTNGFNGRSLAERVGRIAHGKKLFKELQDNYGIAVVPTDFVVGNESGPLQIGGYYRYSKKVIGRSLQEELRTPGSNMKDSEVDKLYSSLATYYRDKLASGEDFVIDISARQFMYGRLQPEDSDKLYLIDAEPFYTNKIGVGANENPDKTLIGQTNELFRMVGEAEAARGVYLPDARESLQQLVQAIPPSTEGYQNYIAPLAAA